MDARAITTALGGKWYGEFGSAPCPAHDDQHPSLSLRDGSDGRLLAKCHTGCGFEEILAALRSRGLVDGMGQAPDLGEVARETARDRVGALKRAGLAATLWAETLPVDGTLAEAFLRRRGIICEIPKSLRFTPSCWHPSAKRIPAMVALIEGAESASVHRTYLDPKGTGKAKIDPTRAMLGTAKGGAVRLVEAQGPLVVAEGIETALSLASGLLQRPATIWATLSTSGMMSLVLPPHPGQLTIATDGDEAGRAAGNRLAERATALGWAVSMLPAPNGYDWNDVLLGRTRP